MKANQMREYWEIVNYYGQALRDNIPVEQIVDQLYITYSQEIILILLNQGFFLCGGQVN